MLPRMGFLKGWGRNTPYGEELANRVADFVSRNYCIAYSHRDYCGTGFFYLNGRFVYDHVTDGRGDFEGMSKLEDAIALFPDRASFVAWLAQQSDESLSGKEKGDPWYTDNQRITRARLEQVLATKRGG
ncbi:hypothetical protein [Hyalangium gracile]|uniref:hypothetical protein n=1 Tax=Hyalangium gracile TaxID=394092 RepID=UPI001CC9B442|nr:hypothetical protein [Hyalangium gracile]